ncbi:MAG: MOSC N-terminal beta barrel domain-containing protein [Candidatus Caldarchaeum sp.]|nr:MOSC N-terminal beta barrel domain-containing protein [Candidatus Caldarchaeum sp.]
MAVVEMLLRYPVKSCAGEELDVCYVWFDGLDGDRVFAVVDAETGYAVSAKKEPRLLEVSAMLVGNEVALVLPDGKMYSGHECDDALSRFLGRRIKIVRNSGQPLRYTGLEIEFGENTLLYEKTGETRETRFHDSKPLHLINLRSMQKIGLDVENIPRFRPNIVYTADENEEIAGAYVKAGDALLKIVKPTKRCIVITHKQKNLPENLQMLKNLRIYNGGELGYYATVVKPGLVGKNATLEFLPSETIP